MFKPASVWLTSIKRDVCCVWNSRFHFVTVYTPTSSGLKRLPFRGHGTRRFGIPQELDADKPSFAAGLERAHTDWLPTRRLIHPAEIDGMTALLEAGFVTLAPRQPRHGKYLVELPRRAENNVGWRLDTCSSANAPCQGREPRHP